MNNLPTLDNVRILLVDDERAITDNLAPFLERSGFSVTVAVDGEEALQQVEDMKPELLMLDVLMPKLDGREVLRRLRRADNWTPIILLTQVGEVSERAIALEEGADDYLNKPFDTRARPVSDANYEDYLMKGKAMLLQILATYETID